ncbi:conserved protein of unknown function [Magnetospirillum sp. XM-1]|uniref:hypothetical protein n=1 Tax=Magnetospirillum sp. XM-1 TaxID=1663591 RepID=UPI00073DD9CB|nr:hypothetical protein [Magnetospirillum sp. XM-1]CUW38932.1 conserved protein of unknown function [Magnetospirillum sp. XM-1]
MAIMVPRIDAAFSGRRQDARQRVWTALRDQLSDDHTVFTCASHAGQQSPDFIVLGPRGLVHIAVTAGILDVLAPPGDGVVWTHRGGDGYFIGAFRADDLNRAAHILERRLLTMLPSGHRFQPGQFGRGRLHVLPDTPPAHTPGIDLASAERRVLINADLGRLGDWVERAMQDNPAAPTLADGLRRELSAALAALAEPAGKRRVVLLRRGGAAIAAALAATVVLALISDRVGSGPSLPTGQERSIQDGRAVFTFPDFIPAKAEWAVRSAIEVAWDNPERPVQWRHGNLAGSVRQLPRDDRPCRAFRINLDLGDVVQSEDRRYCR